MKFKLIHILLMATLISACSDEEPQKAVRTEPPKPQKEDQQLPPNPADVSSTSLGGKPIVTLDLNNVGQANLLRNANAQTPDELVGPAPSPSSNDEKTPSIFNIPRVRENRGNIGIFNTRIDSNSSLNSLTILKAIQDFTEKVDPALDNIEEIIQLEAADSPDFINDDMKFLETVEKAKKLINQPIIHLNRNNSTIATRIKRYEELTKRFEDQLRMLSDIKVSFDQLAAYGYELIVVNDKYQWKEKEIDVYDANNNLIEESAKWRAKVILKEDSKYYLISSNLDKLIINNILRNIGASVNEYGVSKKKLMSDATLKRWRSVIDLANETLVELKEIKIEME